MKKIIPRDSKVPAIAAATQPAAPAHPAAEKDRFVALDIIRLVLTFLVTIFHGLSELTFFLGENEVEAMLRSPLGRIAAVGQGCVDGFCALTGLLATMQLLKRYADISRPKPAFREVLDSYYGRFVGLMLPMFLWAAIYCFVFRAGKYPYSSVRAEAVVKGILQSNANANGTMVTGFQAANGGHVGWAAGGDGLPSTVYAMRDGGAMFWPFLAAGLGNLAPFGGLLQHTWSLAVQWQFYLFLPLVPFFIAFWARAKRLLHRLCCMRVHPTQGHILSSEEAEELERHEEAATAAATSPSFTARQVLAISIAGLLWSLLCRLVAYRKLSDFDPKSLVGFGLDFAAYSNTATRLAPFFAGAIAAALSSDDFAWLVEWFNGGHSRRWHIALSRNALVRLLDLNVVVLTLVNAFWKELAALPDHDPVTGKTKHGYLLIHELAYGFVRPGGILSALAYGWLVFSAMHHISWRAIYTKGRSRRGSEVLQLPAAPTTLKSKEDKEDSAKSTALVATSPSLRRRKASASPSRASLAKAKAASTSPAAPAASKPIVAVTPAQLPAPRPAAPPSLLSKLMGLFALMGFSIYLVNSQVYEMAYGWPDRLHPCPQLLHPAAREAADRLLYANASVNDSNRGVAVQALHAVERAASRAVTAAFSLLRGPEDLYCSPKNGVPSGYHCDGICFGNSLLPYDPRSPQQNVYLAAEGLASPARIPTKAWLQFLHYAGVCILFTWVMAAGFHFMVERPVTGALSAKDRMWRRVFYWPVVAYCLVTLALSIPALVAVDWFILFRVTKAVEAKVAAGGL